MDRKYKKDAFYAYKAWLSDEPFVHICGKRYIDREQDVTKVTVYSNQPIVELFADGESVGKKEEADHFFYFDVKNVGVTKLLAVAGDCRDESEIHKVDKPNEDYRLTEKGVILNWFDVNAPEGYLSLNSKISDIMSTFRGKLILFDIFKKVRGGKNQGEPQQAMGFELNDDMMKMIGGFTLLRLSGMAGMMNISFSKDELLKINKKLNKIKHPKRK